MVAVLLPAPDPHLPHVLRLPPPGQAGTAAQELRQGLADAAEEGEVTLLAIDWRLPLPELRSLQRLLGERRLMLRAVRSNQPETLVAAAALGLRTELVAEPAPRAKVGGEKQAAAAGTLRIHRGTLRSGEHLQAEGSLLLLGDVNPGARLSASGDILVWGRLRGVAHAGCRGDRHARIVALQLRPLQLRIAEAVARGPQEQPAVGLAEQARLVRGEIRIDPAEPIWPTPEHPTREPPSGRP
jgi:septum site-determining protein MinC